MVEIAKKEARGEKGAGTRGSRRGGWREEADGRGTMGLQLVRRASRRNAIAFKLPSPRSQSKWLHTWRLGCVNRDAIPSATVSDRYSHAK